MGKRHLGKGAGGLGLSGAKALERHVVGHNGAGKDPGFVELVDSIGCD